jgi:hypothetical protein
VAGSPSRPATLAAVELFIRADRVCAVAAAAAHDLNDELTVILSSVTDALRALEPQHPARPLLLDLQAAAQRCAWTASGLLNFAARRGARPSAATLDRLVAEDRAGERDTITYR